MLNSGGALVSGTELVITPSGAAQAEVVCRGPGRFYAYCQAAPSRVVLEGLATPLPFRHDAESGKLEVVLPEHAAEAHAAREERLRMLPATPASPHQPTPAA